MIAVEQESKLGFSKDPEIHLLKKDAPLYFFPVECEEGKRLCEKIQGIRIEMKHVEKAVLGRFPYDAYLDAELSKRHFRSISAAVYKSENWIVKRCQPGLVGKKGVGIFQDSIPRDVIFAHRYNNAYRVIMQRRVQHAIDRYKLPFQVPEKYLIPLDHDQHVPECYNYLVACKKIKILELTDGIERLKELNEHKQKILAEAICRLIEETGLIDAKWSNLRFTGDETVFKGEVIPEVALIDTEPFCLITDHSDDPPHRYNELDHQDEPCREKRTPLEVACRYGLREFESQCAHFGLDAMASVAHSHLERKGRS